MAQKNAEPAPRWLLSCVILFPFRWEADEKLVLVAAHAEDSAAPRRPRPAAPEALG